MNGRKLIFAINVTIDGNADHTAVIADAELHDFHTDLLDSVDTILFGRKTYQLLESFWPTADKNPRSTKSMLKFAEKINPLPKIVFSNTLDKVSWNSKLIKSNPVEEVIKLKKMPGKNLSIGGLSIASELARHSLIDEFWFLVQPMVVGHGKRLWEELNSKINLKLVNTRRLKSGVVVLHYSSVPGRNQLIKT
jgi:dihydrofolate reductase